MKREPAGIVEPVKVNLKVPFIQQNGSFDCWHASLRMLFAFRDGPDGDVPGYPKVLEAGQRREAERKQVGVSGLDEIGRRWALKKLPPMGLPASEFATLAKLNGLAPVDLPDRDVGFTSDQVADLVTAHGPLWCALGYFHVVVIKGVDAEGHILVHDPQGGPDKPYTVQGFNQNFAWTKNAIMYLP
ncbi:papain-like cysteine protease family protein [Pseudonocardia sp. TRM90224]|uniref:papain-like cysteine protease family protein n=1 Tax=Pseudonocardia sp. TRM90224 TaxID=2812678 RepID=UPI001E454A09|nr:papain-like cysteine protease family protein [Pseudonocardia sp. TRM90224]